MNLNQRTLKKNRLRYLWLMTLWFAATASTFAQSDITGTVSDETGEPLPGANVLVQGTTNGTQTDFDGNYTISVSADAVVVFSYIGYLPQEISVNDQTTIDVSLIEDASKLDEVVVVGYGSQKKTDLTGAVGQVDGDDLGKFASTNATQSLQGRVAGVNVDTNGGSPGADAFVTIRGTGTLSDAQPLYVVDGLLTDGISNLNPADIESINVLKDASAAAIYGQRAANGVIIVTTKKGRGKISIDLDISAGFDQIINQLDFANARQYADIRNAANDNDGTPRSPANDSQFNPNIDTEIQDASLRSGPLFNTNLRVSGGDENATYSVSANRLTSKGIVKGSEFDRSGLRINTTFTRGRFKLEENLNITQTKRQENNFFNDERDHIPTAPIWTTNTDRFIGGFAGSGAPDGNLSFHGVEDVINSLGLAELVEDLETVNRVQGNLIASYEIIDGLTFKLNAGADYRSINDYVFTPTYFFAASNNGQNQINQLNERNTNFLSTLVENTLNYNKEFGKSTLGLLVGYTEQETNVRSLGTVAQNFPSNDIRVASAAANIQSAPSEESISSLRSFLGRVNYSYDDRYSLTSTIRRDGSSLFANERRFGVFSSFALAWNVINEKFMENQTIFDNLKFRASYGELGSSNVDAYSTAPVLNANSSFITGNTRSTGFSQTAGVNPNIQWETSTTTNVGLDMAFMENKLQFTADYFVTEAADILVGLPEIDFLGFSNDVPANAATLENKGLELFASYRAYSDEDFTLNVSANFTTIKNEVTSLGEGVLPIRGGDFTSNGDRRITRTEPGQPIGAFHGFKVIGIYQTDAEAVADGRVDAVAGDFRFQDTDGNGELNDADKVFLGKANPDFTYGFNIDATYKNWDLSLFFNGVSGSQIANASKWRFTFDTTSNYFPEVANAWTPTNTNTTVPRATLSDTGGNGRPSDYLLENGSYFRLSNLQLGYTLPDSWSNSVGMSRVRLYFTGIRLFTITDYNGYYPESGRTGRGNGTRLFNTGVDDGAYPVPRTLQWGAQISF